jgi:hypothetical protein
MPEFLVVALLLAIAIVLAGGFALLEIVRPTSPVVSCASPPIFALRPPEPHWHARVPCHEATGLAVTFRIRRRVRIAPGLRLHASRGGLSLSVRPRRLDREGQTSLIFHYEPRAGPAQAGIGERAMVRSRVLLCAVVAGLAVSLAGCQDTGYGGYYGAPYYGGGYYGGYGGGYGLGYGGG